MPELSEVQNLSRKVTANRGWVVLVAQLLVTLLLAACSTKQAASSSSTTLEPTPVGTWAGMDYEELGWEILIQEGFEKREHPLFYSYVDGQDILFNPPVEDCQLSYWYGGGDGYLAGEWDYLRTERIIGEKEFIVTYELYLGELTLIYYKFNSKSQAGIDLDLPTYVGSFRLRFGGEIEECVRVTEELLETLSLSGLISHRDIHLENVFGSE